MPVNSKIMIVDDNKGCSDLYRDQFTHFGYVVDQVWNGEAVAASVKEFAPDIIILDLMLPGISGEEVLDWLKANTDTKKIPVIVLTAMLYSEADETRLRKKSEDYLIKIDVTPHQLADHVEKVLANQKKSPSA